MSTRSCILFVRGAEMVAVSKHWDGDPATTFRVLARALRRAARLCEGDPPSPACVADCFLAETLSPAGFGARVTGNERPPAEEWNYTVDLATRTVTTADHHNWRPVDPLAWAVRFPPGAQRHEATSIRRAMAALARLGGWTFAPVTKNN